LVGTSDGFELEVGMEVGVIVGSINDIEEGV